MEVPACPICTATMSESPDGFTCERDHAFTSEGLTLAGNLAAVQALWLAIRALEDDAAGLDWVVKTGRCPANRQGEYARQAAENREAARALRVMAEAAQARLNSLPASPSTLRSDPAQS